MFVTEINNFLCIINLTLCFLFLRLFCEFASFLMCSSSCVTLTCLLLLVWVCFFTQLLEPGDALLNYSNEVSLSSWGQVTEEQEDLTQSRPEGETAGSVAHFHPQL